MAVPQFFEFFDTFLQALSDGEIHKSKEVRAYIAGAMNLSETDRAEMLPSGRQSTFDNRVAWARTYLDRAGLIETPFRGQYRITAEGKKALDAGKKVDLEYLEQYPAFLKFHSAGSDVSATEKDIPTDIAEEKSPMEILDDAFKKVTSSLAEELMTEEINELRQAIRDYRLTKDVYAQYKASGWSPKFYNEHRKDIESHKKAQAVYSSVDGKMPTLKELSAEYDALKAQKENDDTDLEELKPQFTTMNHIKYNFDVLERDYLREEKDLRREGHQER